MRPLMALSLFACMLGLTGCNLPKRTKGAGATGGTGQPFVGSPSSDPAPSPTSDDSSTLASKQGVKAGKGSFAGEVLDTARRRVPDATIKITEVDPGKEAAAPLTVTTDKAGYFDVSGLDAGRTYRLVARKRDGNGYLTGSARVRCPDVRVLVLLTGHEAGGGADEKTNGKEEAKASQTSPGAWALGPPTKSPPANGGMLPPVPDEPGHAPPPPPEADQPVPTLPVPKSNGASDATLIGKDEKSKGFDNGQLPATIPGPGGEPKRKPVEPLAPPPPPMRDGNDVGLKPSSAPSAARIPGAPDDGPANDQAGLPTRVVVPSCVRVGQHVRNFALYDYDGKVWELSRKRQGRLVLIEFWYSKCLPCKHTIPYLNRLDAYYRPYGLDVVSIAHEKGTPVEKQDAVRKIRESAKITYPILFTGGGNEADCPVLKQLEIHEYPTLILLDRNGKILWRGNGLNEQTKYQLEMYVRKQLGIPTR